MTDQSKSPVADAIDKVNADRRPGWDVTDGATGTPYSEAGEKSAGQLLYEKEAAIPKLDPATGKECSPLPPCWDQLSPSIQAKYKFNATVTPKSQAIKP